MTIAEKIQLAVESLGSTADEVAETLRARGINGRRDSGCDCPVARFIRSEVPETAGNWNIAGYWMDGEYVQLPQSRFALPFARVDLPDPVADFVLAFDGGDYAHLAELGATP